MNILDTIILGIVEGITEFLPISSTAHIDITRVLLNIPITDFIKSFEIIIQLGAISAVVVLYYKKLFHSWIYLRNIIIAFIPTGIIGFLLYKIIKSFLLGNVTLAAYMLLIGGVIILIFESRHKRITLPDANRTIESLSAKELLILGTVQVLAVVPGVSRSGAVIIGGRMLGLPKSLITEFSFLLAVPTMLAATVYDLLKSGFAFEAEQWATVSIGFLVSFVVAFLVVKWLIDYMKNHTFEIFGWYRIALGIILLIILL